MPQMAPMNWMMLFLMFTIIFLVFNSLNYFSFKYMNKNTNNKFNLKKNFLNWKW
uniref:ATP synthase complex subunit 8 n=1 Tax=Ochthebius hasegawai TaxID=1309151 RepID=A0A7H0DKD5_9COLE|nr:ATP synthase F0 subunit 8 [Ochthebius hasegawai]QNP09795.1 ATP synthase F0 subunit 8 [Ochthebius hasegawai]